MVSKRELELRVELLEEKVKNINKKPIIEKGYNPVYFHGRAKGNTFRGVLTAILEASSSPNLDVFYITHNYNFARELSRDSMSCIYNLIGESVILNATQNVIQFPNGSRLRFINREQEEKYDYGFFNSLKNHVKIYDHYA